MAEGRAAEEEHPIIPAIGWAARDPSGHLSPFNFSRRATGEMDVKFKVLYTGICHSDLHYIKNEWSNATYPAVPGHEIVGDVTEIGSKVTKFKIGDKVGVGCLVGSCLSCSDCTNHLENHCSKSIFTYGSRYYDGTVTHGGYSDIMVVDQNFAISIPDNLPLDAAAPLLCAGITVYSPLKYFGLDKPGLHVGVVGLGGLGHMAVKFAKAFGGKVTVISTSPGKKEEAVSRLQADHFLLSNDPQQMKAAVGTMDGIIDTVSAAHSLPPLMSLLKSQGKLVLVGAPEKPLEIPAFSLIGGKKITYNMCAHARSIFQVPKGLGLGFGFPPPHTTILVSSAVMKKLSGVQSTDSIDAIALMRIPPSFIKLSNEELGEDDCAGWFPCRRRILVLEGIQDPGNLGTLLRSALAFEWSGVFLLDGCCDPFNEKALRASRGACFHLPIVCGNWTHLEALRNKHQMKLLAGHPHCSDSLRPSSSLSQSLADTLISTPVCLVLGSEGGGISEKTKKTCELISIPMAAHFESLNVAVAGGIFMFMMQTGRQKDTEGRIVTHV